MQATLLAHYGSDLDVVNAARVSFAKQSEEFTGKDEGLIRYLAAHAHWTPFSHNYIRFHLKVPVFVARQLAKHQVGLVVNEVSRRYVDAPPELYRPSPNGWRGRPVNAKQGSSDVAVDLTAVSITGENSDHFGIFTSSAQEVVDDHFDYSVELYSRLIERGVAPEQARIVLPLAHYTEWWWSGNLASFARVCKLRLDPHAQAETRVIAQQISDQLEPLWPVSWPALMGASNA